MHLLEPCVLVFRKPCVLVFGEPCVLVFGRAQCACFGEPSVLDFGSLVCSLHLSLVSFVVVNMFPAPVSEEYQLW